MLFHGLCDQLQIFLYGANPAADEELLSQAQRLLATSSTLDPGAVSGSAESESTQLGPLSFWRLDSPFGPPSLEWRIFDLSRYADSRANT